MRHLESKTASAFPLKRGQMISVINTHDSQVADVLGSIHSGPNEFMPMEDCRVHCPDPSSRLDIRPYSNRHLPPLGITGDIASGVQG